MARKVVRTLQRYPEPAEARASSPELAAGPVPLAGQTASAEGPSWMEWLRRIYAFGTPTLISIGLLSCLIDLFRPDLSVLPFSIVMMFQLTGLVLLLILKFVSAVPFEANPYCDLRRLSRVRTVHASHYQIAGRLFALALLVSLFALLACGAGLLLIVQDLRSIHDSSAGHVLYVQGAELVIIATVVVLLSAGWFTWAFDAERNPDSGDEVADKA